MILNISLSTFFIIILTTLIGALFFKRFKQKPGPPLPPGPKGLPLLGSLHKLDPINPTKSLIEFGNKYGSNGLFGIQLGTVYTVVLIDHNLIKEALNKEVFSGRAPLYLTHGIMDGYGIIATDGERWKDQRKLLFSWMRTLGAARGALARPRLFSKLSSTVDKLENNILSLIDENKNVDIRDLLTNTIGEAINILVYGVSYDEKDPIWKWLLLIQEEGVKAMGVAGILNFLPFLRFISFSLRNTLNTIISGQNQTHKLVECYAEIRKNILNKKNGSFFDVDKDLMQKEMNCECTVMDKQTKIYTFKPSSLIIHEEECILDYFLEEKKRRMQAGDIKGCSVISDKQMNFFTSDIFGAGLDTTNNTLGWFFFMMALYPKEQEAVRQEIHTVCGNNKPDLENMSDLVYTRAALCETQRLRSVVPLGLPHGTVEDTMLAGYLIPKNTMIMPFLWHVFRDPKVWEDPDEFRPSRFIGSDETLIQPASFMPFQIGKRMCPGDDLARMIMYTFGTRIISRYRIEFEEQPENVEGIFGLTLGPPEYRVKMTKLIDWA